MANARVFGDADERGLKAIEYSESDVWAELPVDIVENIAKAGCRLRGQPEARHSASFAAFPTGAQASAHFIDYSIPIDQLSPIRLGKALG